MSRAEADRSLAEAERLLGERRLRPALLAFDAAERSGAAPDRCCAGRWMVWMLKGEFRSAWREADAIRATGVPDPHRFWLGAPIAGKRVIVRSLHGLGDAVMMLQYAGKLRALAAEVLWEVAPDLTALAHAVVGVDRVITWGPDAPVSAPEWDVQVEITELPYLFRTTEADLPIASRYLRLNPDDRREAARAMAEGTAAARPVGDPGTGRVLRVGLSTQASEFDRNRCIPTELLDEWFTLPGIEWWCLDRVGGLRGDPRLRNVRDVCGDGLYPLAAAVANLHRVVTVDTLHAHLGGALGVPTAVMLLHAADWRWMVERSDSPWYPTARLHRQPTPGDWPAVVESVRAELLALLP